MFRHARLQTCLLWLLCAALLLGPAGGAHWHQCFDGQEPATSLHWFDLDLHHVDRAAEAPSLTASHDDTDLSIAGDLLIKGKFQWTPVFALLTLMLCLALPRSTQRFARALHAHVSLTPPAFIRPPLRGPPLNSH